MFHWMYSDDAGVAADGPLVAFATQEAAESWLSDTYPDLLVGGVAAVTLMDDERAVYGPMPLTPA